MDLIKLFNGNIILEDRIVERGTLIFSASNGRISAIFDENGEEVCTGDISGREDKNGSDQKYGAHAADFDEVNIGAVNIDAVQIDAKGNYISPGFIDIHVHGGGGYDFMDDDPESFINAAKLHLQHGSTSLYPTSVSAGMDSMKIMFDNFNSIKSSSADTVVRHQLCGIHLEGPYCNPKYKGAQGESFITDPVSLPYKDVLEAAEGAVSRWSSAPEVQGVTAMGSYLSAHDILPAIAHTDAEYSEVREAFENGYTHMTHFYNAMSSIRKADCKRVLGAVESAYLIDDITVEVIADGMHLPYELLQLVYKLKGADKTALVTDAMRGAGMPDGPSRLGSLKEGIDVMIHDGCAWMPDNSGFAGSTATTDRLVRNMYKHTGCGIVDAVKMASLTPAKIMKIDGERGSLKKGKYADLLIFDDDINILGIYARGIKVM